MEINVLVNGILDRIGSATARNVLRNEDMRLMPVSVTACGAYRKASVNQVEINLIDPKEVQLDFANSSTLLGYGRPDIVVDFSHNSFFRHTIPYYLDAKTSFILVSIGNTSDYVARLSKMIKNLGVNIALLPEDSSEKQIIEAIKYLHKKNENNVFGEVFTLNDVAA